MKHILITILCVLACCSVAFAESVDLSTVSDSDVIDLSTLSDSELYALSLSVREELDARGINGLSVAYGNYVVGDSVIQAGSYRITPSRDGWNTYVTLYESKEIFDSPDSFELALSNEQATFEYPVFITLTDGQVVTLGKDACLFVIEE